MTIEKSCGFFTLTCDNCGEELNDSFFEFHEAVDAKKENGWKSKKVKGEWEDWCDICSAG